MPCNLETLWAAPQWFGRSQFDPKIKIKNVLRSLIFRSTSKTKSGSPTPNLTVPRLHIASWYEASLKEVKVPGLALLDPGWGRGAGPEIGMDSGTCRVSFFGMGFGSWPLGCGGEATKRTKLIAESHHHGQSGV